MIAAIVLAAGFGKRMNSQVPKQYLNIDDKPVIYHTLKAFEESDVDTIILVTGESDILYCRDEVVNKYKLGKVDDIIAGGAQRYDSVYRGLVALYEKKPDYVLIHDGARPLVTKELINYNIESVRQHKACVTAVPTKDTIKIADEEGYVKSTPDRRTIWQIQTPQSFEYELVLGAYQKREECGDETVTDDAMVVEKYVGCKVKLIMGDYQNIKITTPEDLVLAQAFVALN